MADQNFQGGSYAPQQKQVRTGLDPALMKMKDENPEGYIAHMKGLGREDELEAGDHVRAATASLARKLGGYFGGGE